MLDQWGTQLQQCVHRLDITVQRVAVAVAIRRKSHAELMVRISCGIVWNYPMNVQAKGLINSKSGLVGNAMKHWCIQNMHITAQRSLRSQGSWSKQHQLAIYFVEMLSTVWSMCRQKGMPFWVLVSRGTQLQNRVAWLFGQRGKQMLRPQYLGHHGMNDRTNFQRHTQGYENIRLKGTDHWSGETAGTCMPTNSSVAG
jgi:hypothetical protein